MNDREFKTESLKGYEQYKIGKGVKLTIRNTLMQADLFSSIGEFEKAAECYLKLIGDFKSNGIISAFLYE